jgi:hypothetical protein
MIVLNVDHKDLENNMNSVFEIASRSYDDNDPLKGK